MEIDLGQNIKLVSEPMRMSNGEPHNFYRDLFVVIGNRYRFQGPRMKQSEVTEYCSLLTASLAPQCATATATTPETATLSWHQEAGDRTRSILHDEHGRPLAVVTPGDQNECPAVSITYLPLAQGYLLAAGESTPATPQHAASVDAAQQLAEQTIVNAQRQAAAYLSSPPFQLDATVIASPAQRIDLERVLALLEMELQKLQPAGFVPWSVSTRLPDAPAGQEPQLLPEQRQLLAAAILNLLNEHDSGLGFQYAWFKLQQSVFKTARHPGIQALATIPPAVTTPVPSAGTLDPTQLPNI